MKMKFIMWNSKFWVLMCTLVSSTLLTINCYSNTGLVFHQGSWDEVRALAKEQQKPIFVKVYAEYCMPCKMMEDYVFTDTKVAGVFSENFVNFNVDLQSFEGSLFQLAYEIKAVPDLLFFSPEGMLVSREKGAKTKDELLGFAQRAITQMELEVADDQREIVSTKKNREPSKDGTAAIAATTGSGDGSSDKSTNSIFSPERPRKKVKLSLYEMDKMFADGYHKNIFLFDYAYELRENGRSTSEVSKAYVKAQNWKNTSTWHSDNIRYIYDFANEVDHPALQLMAENMDRMLEAYSREDLETKIATSIHNSILEASERQDRNILKKSLSIIDQVRMSESLKLKNSSKANFYEGSDNWKKFCKEMDQQIRKGFHRDAEDLNLLALKVYDNTNKKKLLKICLDWVELSIQMSPHQYNYDTKARILLKLNDVEEALFASEKAIQIAEKQKENCSKSVDLSKRIKNLL